jgi:glycosyltransferase involved in cell wall biosynthesis
MLNVLHMIETGGPGGAETVFRELARGLDPSRFRSFAIIPEEGWVSESLRADGIPFEIMPLTRSADLRYLGRLMRIIAREQIDVIQAHLLASNLYAALAGTLSRIPVVTTFHGQVDVNHRDRLLGVKCRLINHGADAVVFVSEHLRRFYCANTAVKSELTTCIHNGINPTRFRRRPEQALRSELGIRNEETLIGAVGNIRPAKGYDVLLRAAALLKQDIPECRFVIIGDAAPPDLSNRLAELHRTLDLGDTVRYAGFRANIDQVLNCLDIFVLSSRSEGFSLATVEAMAAGLPAVATRCGGPEEIISDGEDGLLVENDNPEAVAAALKRLIVDRPLRERLGVTARQNVLRRFSTEAMVAGYTRLYERVTRGATRRDSIQHAGQSRSESFN